MGFLRRSFFPFNALGMPSFNNNVCSELWACKEREKGVKGILIDHALLINANAMVLSKMIHIVEECCLLKHLAWPTSSAWHV